MKNKKFVFAGNRIRVLEAMIEKGLQIVKIFAVKNSYLERQLLSKRISFDPISDKTSFIRVLQSLEFDYLISNGLPYILPISKLKISGKEFINIHPSYLPDLRGADPVPGAILFGRNTGVTCHLMNDKIDDGDIIEQIEYKYDPNWDVLFLYQISFMLEKIVFFKALSKGFQVSSSQNLFHNNIYYTFSEKDLEIDFDDSPELICRKVKSFNNQSKGAYFILNDFKFVVRDASIFSTPVVFANVFLERQIVFCIENNMCLFLKDKLLYLKKIEGDLSYLNSLHII